MLLFTVIFNHGSFCKLFLGVHLGEHPSFIRGIWFGIKAYVTTITLHGAEHRAVDLKILVDFSCLLPVN